MTEHRPRPHAAAASRILVSGVSTAAALGLVASMAVEATPPSTTTEPTSAVAPLDQEAPGVQRVTVVVVPGPDAPRIVPQPRPAPSTATPVPATRSDGS